MLKGTVFSMTSDQLYHTGEKRSCDVACTACIILRLEVWLSVLMTSEIIWMIPRYLQMRSKLIDEKILSQLRWDQNFPTARPPESLTCRAFSKLVSPGNPWVPRLLSHHWMVVTRHRRHRWKRSGLFAAEKWKVLLSQTSPKCSQLLASWGRFSCYVILFHIYLD